jgi:hypothetical protein
MRNTLRDSVAEHPVCPSHAGNRCGTAPSAAANEGLLREETYEHRA